MKKIMFNDRYGLTQAVLSGRKTMTRRLVPKSFFSTEHDIEDNNTLVFEDMFGDWHDIRESRYALRIGEVLAIAQSYKDLFKEDCQRMARGETMIQVTIKNVTQTPGWSNKMFVRADQMRHQIRITNVRVEKLQDISDEDCIKELGLGYVSRNMGYGNAMSEWVYQFSWDDKMGRTRDYCNRNPKEIFAIMIDKICGSGTWESNPFVFAYEFELVK